MQAINWTAPPAILVSTGSVVPKSTILWKTEPCPVTGSDHGPLDLQFDPEDDAGLHHFVTCLSCDRRASAGVDPITKNIDLFYEWDRANQQTGDNFIWTDYERGTEHPHTKQPVIQTAGPFKGQLWWVP
jgi:hypothetical protein